MDKLKKEIRSQRITLILNFIAFLCFFIASMLFLIQENYFVGILDLITASLWIITFTINYKSYRKNVKRIHKEKDKEMLNYYLKK